MARIIESAMAAAIASKSLRAFHLIELEFDEGTLNLWTGLGDLSWDSKTWAGAGHLLSLQPAEETAEIEARNATFVLSGMPESLVSLALASDYQGRPARMWFGAVDEDGVVIADPIKIFSGFMDVMSIEDDPAGATISLTAESSLVVLRRTRERRYTPEDQKLDFPDDTGLRWVAGLQDKEIVWGQ